MPTEIELPVEIVQCGSETAAIVRVPIVVQVMPPELYGFRCNDGGWLHNMDGVVITGTKGQMLARYENWKQQSPSNYDAKASDYTVAPLPTE